MQSATLTVPGSTTPRWLGRSISALPIMFLIFDGVIKLLALAPVVESFALIGYPARLAMGIGVLELVCVAVYILPRTSVLGAIVLTGYLGGAIASHVRVGSEMFSVIFPIMIGALLWAGLFIRDARLRALVPLRRRSV